MPENEPKDTPGYLYGNFGLHLFGPPNIWCFGWLTGPDSDLICVRPNITSNSYGHVAKSPSSFNPLCAIFAFAIKRILLRIDDNLNPDFYWDVDPKR